MDNLAESFPVNWFMELPEFNSSKNKNNSDDSFNDSMNFLLKDIASL